MIIAGMRHALERTRYPRGPLGKWLIPLRLWIFYRQTWIPFWRDAPELAAQRIVRRLCKINKFIMCAECLDIVRPRDVITYPDPDSGADRDFCPRCYFDVLKLHERDAEAE